MIFIDFILFVLITIILKRWNEHWNLKLRKSIYYIKCSKSYIVKSKNT